MAPLARLGAVYKCLVNGTIDADARTAVAEGLARLNAERFGIGDVEVQFIEIPVGRWFTAGRPSQASMVLGSVPAGTTQEERVEVMDAIARLFSAATGTAYHDVMVVAADRKGS